jgi:hypothetical protein
VAKKPKPQRFQFTDMVLRELSNLSGAAAKLAWAIFSHMNKEGQCQLKIATLMTESGVTHRQTFFHARLELAWLGLNWKRRKYCTQYWFSLDGSETVPTDHLSFCTHGSETTPTGGSETRPTYKNNILNTDNKTDDFDRFWEAYPRKVNKKQARKAWDKLNPDKTLIEKIINAVKKAKHSQEWQADCGKYIPHPSTYLNNARWEDELRPKQSGKSKWV